MCFEGKPIADPASIIYFAYSLMGYWVGLFVEQDKEALISVEGVNTMMAISVKLVAKKKKQDHPPLRDADDEDVSLDPYFL